MVHPSGEAPREVPETVVLPLSFIIFFSVLNGIMFNVAVPDIASEFGLMPSEVSWVMTAYIVVFAIGTLIYGKLADIYAVRSLITIGLLLLNLGSLLGFFSRWYPMLIAARVLQASGGSAIPALAMLVATKYFPSSLKGRVLGVIASTVALAAGMGPIAGGVVAGTLHWRYLFVFSLATLLTIPRLRRILPVEQKAGGRFDTAGALLLSLGMASLLFFVTQGIGWFLPLGGALILWFVFHIRRREAPFLDPSLFQNTGYRNALIASFFAVGTVFGMMFMVPIMLRELNALSSEMIGLTMFPGAMCAALVGTYGGRLADRRGAPLVFSLGVGSLVLGFLLLSSFAGMSHWLIAGVLVITYSGFSFIQSSLPHTVSSTLPHESSGVGMGVYNMVFFVSGAFLAAGIGRVLDLGETGLCLNPLNTCGPAWSFSNICVILAALALAAWVLYFPTFRKVPEEPRRREQ
jgi:DHA2 family metal-tetracycline-proton antiporter-like MFS transporter